MGGCIHHDNPLSPESDLKILLCLMPEDLTLSNAFYSSKGDPLGLKGLKKLSPVTL